MALFEYVERGNRCYYRITLRGARVELHFGLVGTDGSHRAYEFDDPSDYPVDSDEDFAYQCQRAAREYERQIADCHAQGYRLVTDGDAEIAALMRPAEPIESTATPLSDSPRYLFVHAARGRFTWVEADGHRLLTAAGPVGRESDAKPEVELCVSTALAAKKRDRIIAELMAQGFELEAFGKASDRIRDGIAKVPK